MIKMPLLRLSGFVLLFSLSGLGIIQESSASGIMPSEQDSVERGKKIWFESMYGGDRFFEVLAHHPDPAKRISVGFENVIKTPRNKRFEMWGVVNDPDCKANPNGGADLCVDPTASGVIGIRKALKANGQPSYGMACASCHAGFDPLNPPTNLNEPKWENIHPTIGNQYLDSGKVFAANLPSQDPRHEMFAAWPKGTVDTTLLFGDNIMNPGVITAFWNLKDRPTFDVGKSEKKIRSGQGGEDDLGGDIAAMRVYMNLGVCYSECVAPNPGRPIDIQQCQKTCSNFPPQRDLDDLVAYLETIQSPQLPPSYFSDAKILSAGKKVFETNCASCHSTSGSTNPVLSNDEVNPLISNPSQNTNVCRTLTSNWEEGKIWAEFSSSVYKKRVADGLRGYRSMPLKGIWATTPFLHNQSVGVWPTANASLDDRVNAFEVSMKELLNSNRVPKINVSSKAIGPFPAGTPLTYIFSRNPITGALLCDDTIENRGHTYGSELKESDKDALIYWLKSQ